MAQRFMRSMALLSLGFAKLCSAENLCRCCIISIGFKFSGILTHTYGNHDRQYEQRAMCWVRDYQLIRNDERIHIWNWPYYAFFL